MWLWEKIFFWSWGIHSILELKRNEVFIITVWLAIMVESVQKIVAKFACGYSYQLLLEALSDLKKSKKLGSSYADVFG